MTSIAKFSGIAASLLCATAAWPADFQVKRSLELPASTPQVWHLIGDFCDIDDWHPKVSSCALKVMDGSLVRVLTTDKFTATLSVQPGENLLIEWIANFSSDDPAMERVVVEDIEGGLSGIKNIMTSR